MPPRLSLQSIAQLRPGIVGGGGAENTLLNDLIAYWTMNEASTGAVSVSRLDSSGRENHLTDGDKALSATGHIDNAVSLASSKRLTRVSNADLQTGDIDFTFAFWIYVPTTVQNAFYWGKSTGQYTDVEYLFAISAGKPALTLRNSGNTAYGGATWGSVINPDTWYWILCEHDSVNDLVAISVNNGTRVTNAFAGGVRVSTNGLTFAQGSSGAAYYIDEVGFWKRLLTDTEKADLFAGGAGLSYPFF